MKALFVFIVSCLIFCQSDTKYYEIDKSIERDLTLHKNKDSNCKYSSGTIGYFMYSGLQVKKSLEGLEDRIKLLHHQIKKLNIIEKGIVLLYLEGKSYDTIAEITGFTKTNVGTRLSRIKEKLKTQIITQLNLEEVGVEDFGNDDPIFGDGLGLDSIDALELIVLLEKEYGLKVANPEEGGKIFTSINTMANYIRENTK